jgi:hypothetical protein
VYVNVSVIRLSIRDCRQSRDTDIDIHKEKDVGDMTIRNGQSRDTNIDMHNNVYVSVSRLSIPDCLISNVFFLCMSMSVSLDCPFLIVTSLTSFYCAWLEMGQSGMDNLETLTLTYTRKRR